MTRPRFMSHNYTANSDPLVGMFFIKYRSLVRLMSSCASLIFIHPLYSIQRGYIRRKARSEYHLLQDEDEMDSPQHPDCEKGTTGLASVKTSRKKFYLLLLLGVTLTIAAALAIGLGVHYGLVKRDDTVRNAVKSSGATLGSGSSNSTSGATVGNAAAIDSNFADPCYIQEDDTYYAFATNKLVKPGQSGQVNIQIATSKDFKSWDLSDKDALPQVGNWSSGHFVWAPDVVKVDDGSFVMYYTAQLANSKEQHCIGAATSKNVEGPYTPSPNPIICPLDQGGAIDPEGFKDSDGTRYLIYKIDGNSLNRKDSPLHPTPLMLQEVEKGGIALKGSPIQLLDRGPEDGPLIEAPAMGRYEQADGSTTYVLFYSSNVFTTKHYDVSYATSQSVKGPFTRSTDRLLETGGKLIGPGGMDNGVDGHNVVFHSILHEPEQGRGPVTRTMWTANIEVNGLKVTI